jgi:molybdopterin-guanine dinucleotide biosynthesis protein A
MKRNLINYNKTQKIISFILLGGKSSRMNYNKAFLSLPCNSSFLEFIVSKIIPFLIKLFSILIKKLFIYMRINIKILKIDMKFILIRIF